MNIMLNGLLLKKLGHSEKMWFEKWYEIWDEKPLILSDEWCAN